MRYALTLFLLLFVSNTFACGSTAHWFSWYWDAKDLKQKNNHLKQYENFGCSMSLSYSPRIAEPIIVKVLVDAIESGVEKKIINGILKKYNCVYGARKLPIYSKIKEYITGSKYNEFCNIEKIHRIYIIRANSGVVLRSDANKNSKRIGTIAHGSIVIEKKANGDWINVKSYAGEGYVFKSLLESY